MLTDILILLWQTTCALPALEVLKKEIAVAFAMWTMVYGP